MSNLPHTALGAGFAGATGNKLLTVNQKPGADPTVTAVTEKKKWMQDVKSTGECTPMSKPTCTGKKKAFAKRVQKSGDLYSGKK